MSEKHLSNHGLRLNQPGKLRIAINLYLLREYNVNTAQKMKFSITDFFSKCDFSVTCGFGHIYWKNL